MQYPEGGRQRNQKMMATVKGLHDQKNHPEVCQVSFIKTRLTLGNYKYSLLKTNNCFAKSRNYEPKKYNIWYGIYYVFLSALPISNWHYSLHISKTQVRFYKKKKINKIK